VTAAAPTPSVSAGSIIISFAPKACSDVKSSHSFTFSMTDSINTPVTITIQIDVVNPAPLFSSWIGISPFTIPIGTFTQWATFSD